MYSVFRDTQSHCCLRVAQKNGKVDYIAMTEEGGEICIDLHRADEREFYRIYNHELTEYPVRRAAQHYLNPLTPAIRTTPKAQQILNTILENKTMSDDALTPVRKSRSERNIEATEKASIRTNNKVHAPPAPAPVIVEGEVTPPKKPKGTPKYMKETNVETSKRIAKKVLKQQEAEKQEAAAKAERKAAKAANKKAIPATTKNLEKTMSTENNTATAAKNDTAPTKKVAKKTEAAPAKKVVKKTEAAPAKKASKKADEAPAKKVVKKVAKKAEAPVAKKLAKGTGKQAAPAKKTAPPPAKKAGKAEKESKGGRKGRYDESMKISVLVKDNPKREGTEAYDIFELLKKSKTVGDFFAKGGTSANLRWNENHEYIKVG